MRRMASRMLAEDSVFRGVQTALKSSLEARRMVDRNVGRLLAILDVPSNQDMERLFDHMEQLDADLARVSARIEALAQERER